MQVSANDGAFAVGNGCFVPPPVGNKGMELKSYKG